MYERSVTARWYDKGWNKALDAVCADMDAQAQAPGVDEQERVLLLRLIDRCRAMREDPRA